MKFEYFAFSYEDLISGERSTHQEIKSLEKKIESWSQQPAPTTAAAINKKAANAAAMTTSLPPAVAAFEVMFLDEVDDSHNIFNIR